MIVRDVMRTELITVNPDDTLSHAASLLRQYQFHHLPVISTVSTKKTHISESEHETRKSVPVFEGMLTSRHIDLVAAAGRNPSDPSYQPWQDRHVKEVMHSATIRVTPATNVAAAAQVLVERGMNCLPVVEYEAIEQAPQEAEPRSITILVGLLTRSDLLISLARLLGAYEPGMQLILPLSEGDLTPLARALLLAAELHIHVHSVVAAPLQGSIPRVATVRLGTINPTVLLLHLQKEHIHYMFADPLSEGDTHV